MHSGNSAPSRWHFRKLKTEIKIDMRGPAEPRFRRVAVASFALCRARAPRKPVACALARVAS
jgi:hypothetical protein